MTKVIQQQLADRALFSEILWNKPLNKQGAGKLLIVGGNKHRFFAPAQAQAMARSVGIGQCRVLLPDVVKRMVGSGEDNEFAPSNPSGSFAQNGLDALLSLAEWSDAVLFAGDVGHNSETALLVEKFLTKFQGRIIITQDTLDFFVNHPEILLQRDKTLIVASFSQLQKIVTKSEYGEPFTSTMSLRTCLEQLSELTLMYSSYIVTMHQRNLIVAVNGQVSHMKSSQDIWRVEQASKSAVLWLQQPDTPYETITTSLLSEQILRNTE